MAELKSSSTAGGSLVWTQTNLPVSPQDGKIFYKDMELVDSKNNQTIAGKKDFTTGATVPTPVLANDATNKSYVDGKDSTSVKSVRGTAPIRVTTGVNPTVSIDAATPTASGSMSAGDKAKLDNHPFNVVNKDGDTVNGNLATTGNFSAQGKITSTANAGIENMDDVYAQRMVLSGSQGYFQAGKKDRDVNDQKMVFSGWFGTPLSQYRISMATGIQPQVLQGGVNYDILHRGNMPTPEDIKAMAIYDRPTGDDCNNAILPGNYGIFANTANTPFGIGPSGSTLLVTRWGNGANSQIFFPYGSDRVFVRRQHISVWQPWFELYSTSNKQPVGGMGLGVGDAPNALTITGNVRDFNLAKINGTFTIEGSWANGVNNTANAEGHAGILQISQRSIDNLTVQKYTTWLTGQGVNHHREFTRIWINDTEGWNNWLPSGTWESVNTYRTGILRLNNQTNDDSVYPYVSYTKEKYRDTIAPGTYYTVGEISFRAGSSNRYDPHSGDQLSRILGMVTNTATAGEYDGSLFLASRLRRTDGTVADSSTLAINRDLGVEFTHAAKKVQINTGRVTADEFFQNTAQSSLANSSTRKDYVDAEVATKVSKAGDTMTGSLTLPTAKPLYFGAGNNTYLTRSGDDLFVAAIAGTTGKVVIEGKVNPQVRIGTSNYNIYHAGNKPTSTELGVVNIAGDVMTGNLIVDVGTTAEPQVGVRRSGRRLYMADNGVTVGLYNIIGGSFINTFMISRNINDGNITVGSDSNNTIIRGAGNLKHGTADIYTTSNKPSPADIGTLTTAQINAELAKQVSKTGDTMSGALTTTQVNATNNYAFVSSIAQTHGMYLGNTASDKRLILGGGNPTIGAVHIRPHGIGVETSQTIFNTDGTITNGATPTEPGHLTNKVYVDGQISQQVSKSGDTMTGQLLIQTANNAPIQLKSTTAGVVTPQYIVANDSTGAQRWYIGQASANSPDVLLYSTGNGTYLRLESNQVSFNKNPISTALQGTAAGSLVRRDFLESSLSIQTPNNAIKIPVANLNDYQTPGYYYQDSNANAVSGSNYPTPQAGALVVTKAAGVIQEYTIYGTGARYVRAFYTNVWSSWALVYDSTRPPGATAVGALPIAGGTLTGGYLQIRGSSNPMLELHQPGQAAAVMYLTPTGQFRLGSGNGAGGETNVRMTVEPNGNVYSAGSITSAGYMLEGGARVYSPNNPQPSLTPTQIGNALASMSYDAVGQYAMLLLYVDKGNWLVPGTVVPGSQLRYSTAEGKDPGGAPPGNWRLHGRTNQGGQWGGRNVSLWQRVS
ncbi:gp36 hinge connector of long tail fiber distal connector [Aeromonas phage 65]|uniref:Gp36 hinge connector of long tail fiber distal connector n=1 Tax=Aeromonas phage 65 TaxID=2919549 RepID=E5DRZ3_9CAUD|nr:tail fiber protein [Aeromonas phage 65]ADQ53167.1 gp36 hinge connector of long tail fiber distal connector [Aeromonas phage 65]